MKLQNFILLLALLILSGCASDAIQQRIVGHINFPEDEPAIGMVILAAREQQKTCEGNVTVAAIEKGGSFEVVREVHPGKFSVRVQRDTLCVFTKNGLQVVWKRNYGPAPNAIKFECDLQGPAKNKCDVYFKYNSEKADWRKISSPEETPE